MNEVVMPKMSDLMEEGKILTWLKKPGDTVTKGDGLAEVETEKVNIEVPSFFAGTLRKILVGEGETVAVGTPIALVGAPNEALPDDTTANAPAPQQVREPVAAGGMNGAAIQPRDASAFANGNNGSSTLTTQSGRRKVSPLARRLADEYHLDLAVIRGTGPEGRIIKEDIDAAIAAQAQPAARTTAPAAMAATQPAGQPAINAQIIVSQDVEIVPLSNMRRTIAARLQQSMQQTPHFYVTMAMDATRLVEMREQVNDALERQGDHLKISYNDLIVMAVARGLGRHPEINVSFDGDRLLRRKAVHIGVAVALDDGLIVPVVRNADKRSLTDLAREIRRLAEAARTNKLQPQDFSGGTFTISNLGMLDVETFTAIINPPEAAILAVGAIVPTPVVIEGQVAVRQQIKMTLSSDHRAIDGAQAAYFLRDVKALIETPASLLI